MTEDLNSENKPLDPIEEESKKKKLDSGKLIALAIIIGGLVIAGSYTLFQKPKIVEKCPGESLSSQEAGEKALNYVNKVLIEGEPKASLKEVAEENCLYRVKINVNDRDFDTFITRDGKTFFIEGKKIDEELKSVEEKAAGETIGGFSTSGDAVCEEGGKPIIYFFGSSGCPHCQWEKPVIEGVVAKFPGLTSFHENIDSNTDQEVFEKYSTGGVPTLVFGCRYFRVGSGESEGETKEANSLTALICKLTNNQPQAVCNSVQDLVGQIKD